MYEHTWEQLAFSSIQYSEGSDLFITLSHKQKGHFLRHRSFLQSLPQFPSQPSAPCQSKVCHTQARGHTVHRCHGSNCRTSERPVIQPQPLLTFAQQRVRRRTHPSSLQPKPNYSPTGGLLLHVPRLLIRVSFLGLSNCI